MYSIEQNRKIIAVFYDFLKNFKIVKFQVLMLILLSGLIFFAISLNSSAQKVIKDNDKDKSVISDTVPPMVLIYVQNEDGSAQGEVIDMPDDDAIRSNLGSIRKSLDENFYFPPVDYKVGVDRRAKWSIEVKDKFKDALGSVVFSDFDGNSTSQSFIYIAPKFRLSPADYNFGEIITGEKPFSEFVITNDSYDRYFVLDRLSLKHGDQGFEIVLVKNQEGYLGGLPKKFEPRESLKFRVYFNAKKEGSFSDSIGIGTSYAFAYASRIYCKVASPVIVANDLNFFDITIGDTVKKTVSVHNKGLVDLKLNAYLSTRLPFWTTLPQITNNEPYIISPGGRLNFEIYFAPDSLGFYKDSVIFFSNATGLDNVVYINGHGVKPGLIVSSFDWGRMRINPIQPYTSPEYAVWLTNTAEDTITIYNIEKKDTLRSQAFEFVESEFQNLKVASRQTKFIEVAFNPREVGHHSMTMVFNNSYGSESKSVFKGIGIAPKISTYDVHFDTSLVNDVFTPVNRKVIFYNENWEFADMVFIDSIMILPNGDEISVDTSDKVKPWGSEGFKIFNINKRSSPWLIDKGDSLVMDVNFVAQREGPASAAIRSVSDALFDTTSFITGTGIFRGIKSYTPPVSACVSDLDTFDYHIENYGWDNIHIDSVRIFENNSIRFVDTTVLNGFDIFAQEKKVLQMVYAPNQVEQSTINIYAYHSYAGLVKEEKTLVNVQSFFTPKSITTYLTNEDSVLNIGEILKVRVLIDHGEDISKYFLKNFDVRIEFNSNFLEIGKEDIYPGEVIKTGFLKPEKEKINIDMEKGIVTFPINAFSNGYLTSDGEILKYEFRVVPPKSPDSVYCSNIITHLNTVGNHCVEFSNSNIPSICLNSFINDNLEWIDFNGSRNKMLDIYPNPAEAVNPHLDFEIKEEGFYEIKLFNPLGQFVSTVVSSNLRPGNYRATLPVINQPSGVYTCLLINSHFTLAKKFVFIR